MSTEDGALVTIDLERSRRTVGEELAEHEGVVGLWVVFWELDVLVHVKGHNMLEPGKVSVSCAMRKVWSRRTRAFLL